MRPESLVPDGVPVWLQQDLARVLGDFALPAGVSVEVRPDAQGYGLDVYLVEAEIGQGACLVAEEMSSASRLFVLADGIQTELFETRSGYGVAQPPCLPGHRHPPHADLTAEAAVWRCPDTNEVVAPIGEATHGP